MFEMRTNFRDGSITSSLVIRSHHSNLSNRIERFVRFLRENNVQTKASSTIAHRLVALTRKCHVQMPRLKFKNIRRIKSLKVV